MPPQSYYEGIEHVIYISTSIRARCEDCDELLGGSDELLAPAINHHIEQHGYKLLHVGTETSRNISDDLWLSTVAVLSK